MMDLIYSFAYPHFRLKSSSLGDPLSNDNDEHGVFINPLYTRLASGCPDCPPNPAPRLLCGFSTAADIICRPEGTDRMTQIYPKFIGKANPQEHGGRQGAACFSTWQYESSYRITVLGLSERLASESYRKVSVPSLPRPRWRYFLLLHPWAAYLSLNVDKLFP